MKPYNLFKICVLLVTLITITSCFEVIEEIDLKSDGSGTMTYTLNLSKSKSKIASIMLLDSINGYKVPSRQDIQKGLNDIVAELNKADGITNVTKTADYENFIFSVKCNFKDVDKINKIATNVSNKQKNKMVISSYFFDKNNGQFKRKYTYSDQIKKQYSKLNSKNKKVFDDASYTAIYRFDKTVLSQNNSKAKVSKSKKAVMQRLNAMEIIDGSGNLSTQIKLSK